MLINGWSASCKTWPSAWVRELAQTHRVICPDNRGSGWSRFADTPFTLADLADDVADVLDAEDVRTATVLGISMGGMIAQELALRHPERVERLILVGTRAPAPEFVERPGLGHRRPDGAPARAARPLYEFFRMQWGACAGPGFAERHPERLDELARQMTDRPTPRAAARPPAAGHGRLARRRAAGGDRRRRPWWSTAPRTGWRRPANGRRLAELIPARGATSSCRASGISCRYEAPEALNGLLSVAHAA